MKKELIKLCEQCGNEYRYREWQVKPLNNHRTGETIIGTKCPYCKYINAEKNPRTKRG